MEGYSFARVILASASDEVNICRTRIRLNEEYYQALEFKAEINKPMVKNTNSMEEPRQKISEFHAKISDLRAYLSVSKLLPFLKAPSGYKGQQLQEQFVSISVGLVEFISKFRKHEEDCEQYHKERKLRQKLMADLYEKSKHVESLKDLSKFRRRFAEASLVMTPEPIAAKLDGEWNAWGFEAKLEQILAEFNGS